MALYWKKYFRICGCSRDLGDANQVVLLNMHKPVRPYNLISPQTCETSELGWWLVLDQCHQIYTEHLLFCPLHSVIPYLEHFRNWMSFVDSPCILSFHHDRLFNEMVSVLDERPIIWGCFFCMNLRWLLFIFHVKFVVWSRFDSVLYSPGFEVINGD